MPGAWCRKEVGGCGPQSSLADSLLVRLLARAGESKPVFLPVLRHSPDTPVPPSLRSLWSEKCEIVDRPTWIECVRDEPTSLFSVRTKSGFVGELCYKVVPPFLDLAPQAVGFWACLGGALDRGCGLISKSTMMMTPLPVSPIWIAAI